jgi:hypothetical protein
MADSLREQIMNAVATRMGTILTANGYATNIGSKFHEWKVTAWEENEVPGVTVRDYEETIEHAASSRDYPKLKVGIEAADIAVADLGAQARKIIADITKAVGTDVNWTVSSTRLAQMTKNLGNKVQAEQENETIVVVTVEIEIDYRMAKWDPYTQVGQ